MPSRRAGSRSSGCWSPAQATGGESSDTIYAVLGGSGPIIAALAMVAIAIGTIAVNAMNDYTGSLSLQAAGVRIKRVYSAAVVAVLGFLFTLYLQYNGDFSPNFVNFLLFISYWISPFVGVVLADWWLRRPAAPTRQSIVDFARLPIGHRRAGGAGHRVRRRHPVPELVARLRVGRARSTTSPPTTCTAPTWRTTSAALVAFAHLLVRGAQRPCSDA